jgi:hypothetical protein
MRRIVRFYEDIQPANNRIFYKRSDILNRWSDYRLQVRKNYINWLFPSKSDPDTKLSSGAVYKFRTNVRLRAQVVKATLRMMSFFGYSVNPETMDVVKIKPLYREEGNVVIGLYNPDNYPRITRILTFLTEIRMQQLSALFFLMLCKAMKSDPALQEKIKQSLAFQDWVKTQDFLIEQRYIAEEKMFGEELEDWEKWSEADSVHVEPVHNDAWSL